MQAWMYILRCADGSYSVGSTRDIDERIWQHERGEGAAYTRHRLPVELVHLAEFERVDEAFAWEKQVQGWSRAKREALIRGGLDALPALSRRGGPGRQDQT
jgi:predicted GIY-YIG superfamily endonuclease